MGRSAARVFSSLYGDWIDDQLFVGVQLESIQAVDNAEAIMATPEWMAAGPARPTWPYPWASTA